MDNAQTIEIEHDNYNIIQLPRDHHAQNSSLDIVLLQLPFWGVGCPPLALGTLPAHLKEQGVSCEIIDINGHAYVTKGKKYFEYWHVKNGYNFCMEHEPMLEYYSDNRALFLHNMEKINRLNPKFVGCSVQNTSRILTEIFLEDFRNIYPGYNHILGGPEVAHFMNNTEELLSHDYVDAVCQDEGEKSLVDYIRTIKSDPGKPVPGMVYKKDGKTIRSHLPSEYISKLDDLPFPDFEGANIRYYASNALPTYSSRGCVNKCNYCSAIGFMTNKRYPFRLRSAQRMFDEIVSFKAKYPAMDEVRMCDNISNAKIKTLLEFCDLMIDSGMNKKIKWSLENAVIRKEMRKPVYDKLKEAGCTLLGYGMETPSVRLLHDVGKNLAVNKDVDLPAILKEGKDAGLVISVNVMFGLPTETEDDFNFLMEFLRDNKDAFSMVNPSLNFCEYYPGSKGYHNPEEHSIDLSKGTLFWDSADGKNTYLTRMKRFEKFCRLAKEFKIDNLFQIQELPNKHKLLFDYYYVSNDVDNCVAEYEQIDQEEITEEIKAKYLMITTGNTSALKGINAAEKIKLEDYFVYKSYEANFLAEPLTDFINDFIEIKSYDMEYPTPLKTSIRWGALYSSGYSRLDLLINNIMRTVAEIDQLLISSSVDTGDFSAIDIGIHRIELYAKKIRKILDGFIGSNIAKLNSSHYIYFQLHNMLDLFVSAFKEINHAKLASNAKEQENKAILNFIQSAEDMDASIANTSVMTPIERISKEFRRAVGYKEVDKKNIAVHTVLYILLQKIQIIVDKHQLRDVDKHHWREKVTTSPSNYDKKTYDDGSTDSITEAIEGKT